MRSRSAASVMPGETVHTPLIIIRLLGESMRSQAVSTLLMRTPDRPSMPVAARRTFFCTALAASRARSGKGRPWDGVVPSAGVDGVWVAVPEGVRLERRVSMGEGSRGWVG